MTAKIWGAGRRRRAPALKTTQEKPRAEAPTAQSVVDAIRRHGSDAVEIRDAAHEASHALQLRLPCGDWDREQIHRELIDRGGWESSRARVFMLRTEILARAVEQLVCTSVGVDCGTIEHWAFVSCMESLKLYRVDIGKPAQIAHAVDLAMSSPEALALHRQILALR